MQDKISAKICSINTNIMSLGMRVIFLLKAVWRLNFEIDLLEGDHTKTQGIKQL